MFNVATNCAVSHFTITFFPFTNIFIYYKEMTVILNNIMYKPILQKVNKLTLKATFMKNIYSVFKLTLSILIMLSYCFRKQRK